MASYIDESDHVNSDSECFESIHKISDVCYGEESISVGEFPKQTKRIVKNTLKHNPWLISDYSGINLHGKKHTPKRVGRQFSDNVVFVYFVKHSDTKLSGVVRVLLPEVASRIRHNVWNIFRDHALTLE